MKTHQFRKNSLPTFVIYVFYMSRIQRLEEQVLPEHRRLAPEANLLHKTRRSASFGLIVSPPEGVSTHRM